MSAFEEHRQFLVGVAYRMLGSFAEADDVVQDAYLRWSAADRGDVEHPRAYLARVVSRLCLDRMKSAAARREEYPGTWLPEPLVADVSATSGEDLSMALLMTLERLSPLERAAFLLHDVFDMDYSAIAQTIERSESAVRQLAARAREHVRDERPRFTASPESQEKLANAFAFALASNDVDGIARLLADEAVFYTDGGGKRHAALNPIHGRDKIVRFLLGVTRKALPLERVDRVQINGLPGFVVWTSEGPETLSLHVQNERIVALYGIRNPDKLRHLS